MSGDKGLDRIGYWIRGFRISLLSKPLDHQQAHNIRDMWNAEANPFMLP